VSRPRNDVLHGLWERHHAEWRSVAQIMSHWREAASVDPRLLEQRVRGPWWDVLEGLGVTLFISREYEHLVMAYAATGRRRSVSFLPLPHPSGLVVDRKRSELHVASTRNPNQIFTFRPISELEPREARAAAEKLPDRPMLPTRSTFLPGSLYLHDLALVGGRLHGNAVGQNAVVSLHAEGRYERVWWPRSIEGARGPMFNRNYLQMNSIAAGASLRDSFFSASVPRPGRLRPGHLRYPVDGNGVIFSGRTREPMCGGLTRPHSARLHRGEVWVDNSGYGELGVVRDGRFEVVTRLPGWTRGLCIVGDVAFVGTSQVIAKYARYAPGLGRDNRCAVHAVDLRSARVLASVEWPAGNQIFAIDWMSSRETGGFLFVPSRAPGVREKTISYAYRPRSAQKENAS
jgi:uncharacterized protein (TIGR03032 family)